MQKIKSVTEAEVAGKRVLMRADLNVPMVTVGDKPEVANDLRIRAILPTLELLHANGAANIIILAHLGRPGGMVDEAMRLAPVQARLRDLTAVPFEMHENLRFNTGEEANDPAFAQELAVLGDIFVNEAFADSHRAHASIVGVPKLLPSYAGLRFTLEVQKLSGALTPPKGALAIVGGDKFETKQPLIAKLLSLYDGVLLGGALGNDVIKARGMPFGDSLISSVPVPPEIAGDERLLVPTDAFVAEAGHNAERVASIADTRANEAVIDIGPQTAALWSEKIREASFILWNGPMGLYETGYSDGTDALAQTLAESKIPAVVGGGDTTAAIEKYKFDPARVFISTGGGAMLEFLTAGTLPGIEALQG
jgi:phosphoglycerate kinase